MSIGLKKDQSHEALVTLVLVLLLQGDFQQAKDYVDKLSVSFGNTFQADSLASYSSQEFIDLLTDYIVCSSFYFCSFIHNLISSCCCFLYSSTLLIDIL